LSHNIRYWFAAKELQLLEKNECKQDICGDYEDRVITSPFPIAYPIEYSTKILLDFVQLKDFKGYLISKSIMPKKASLFNRNYPYEIYK